MNDVAKETEEKHVIGIRMDLDQAYARYQSGKGFGRADLFRLLIDEVKELQRRIGAVDEAAVTALTARVAGLESIIWNAMQAPKIVEPKRKPGRPSNAEIATREASNG